MAKSAPSLRDLSKFAQNFEFEKHGYSTLQWEVFVPQRRCLLWCVVLSFLRSADFSKNFYPRLKALILEQDRGEFVVPEWFPDYGVSVKDSISKFNPFRNHKPCYIYDKLSCVVSSFKERLNAFHEGFRLLRVRQKMQVMCDFLSCRIVWIHGDTVDVVQPQVLETAQIYQTLVIFKSVAVEEGKRENSRFSFGLTKSRAAELRQIALKEVLKAVEIPKEIRTEICEAVKEDDGTSSLLIPLLLQSNTKNSLLVLFGSPYAIYRLSNAGYITDPRKKDQKGLSAFYYALTEPDILYALYNAANLRDLDSSTLSNFKSLESVLQSDYLDSNDFESLGNDRQVARLNSEQLRFLNECLSKISEKIHVIREEPSDTDMEVVAKQKKVIESILEVYNEYFFINSFGISVSCLEHYSKYKTYYDNLDYIFTLLLCDNIFLLKEKLLLPEEISYSKLESAFLLTTMSNKYFLALPEKSTSTNLNLIPLLERFHLREVSTNFCQGLKEMEVKEESVVKCVPGDEIALMLTDHPVARDEAVFNRLRRFMDMTKTAKLSGVQLRMVVERCLQVVGESLKVDDNPFTIRHLLRSCLPEEAVRTLIQIRNRLCHLESCELDAKISAENDEELFKSMRSELIELHKAFEVVYEVQKRRIMEFLVSRGLELLQKEAISDSSIEMNKDNLEKNIKYLNDMLCNKLNTYPFHKKDAEFKCILYSLISTAENAIERYKLGSPQQLSKERAMEILWPVKYLLNFLRVKCKLVNLKNLLDLMQMLSDEDSNVLSISIEFLSGAKVFTSKLDGACKPFKMRYISKFKEILAREHFTEDKEAILRDIDSSIKEKIQRTEDLKQKLKEERTKQTKKPKKEMKKKNLETDPLLEGLNFDTLYIPEKQKSDLRKIDLTKNSDKAITVLIKLENPLHTLDSIFSKKFIPSSKVESVCVGLQLPDATKNRLLRMSSRDPPPPGDPLAHLLDRMSKLKAVAISEDVRDMWEKATNPKTREFMAVRIVRRYFQDRVFQATLEMLLFDCLNLILDGTSVAKTSHLFSGVNVRNVLAHGDPLLETVGGLLDPQDLPMELARKSLRLLEDEDVVRAVHEAWETAAGKSMDLTRFIEDLDEGELKKRIAKCERWRVFSGLIKPKHVPGKIPPEWE